MRRLLCFGDGSLLGKWACAEQWPGHMVVSQRMCGKFPAARRLMRHGRLGPSLADCVTAANAVCGFVAIVVVARAWADGATPDGRLPHGDLILAGTLIIAGAAL